MEEKKKKTKKKMTKEEFLKKNLKKLIIACVILGIVAVIIKNVELDNRTIYQKIGTREPYSISIKDALNIKVYSLMTYKNLIINQKYKDAYGMLAEEYQRAVSYEEFLKSIEGIDFETFDMKDIKIKAENTYVATVVYEKNKQQIETKYMLYMNKINSKNIKISPDNFLYNYKNLKFKMDGMEIKIEQCNVYTDKINLVMNIKNTSLFEKIEINNVGIGYNDGINKNQNVEISLKPGENKEINLEYDTDYYIPNNLKIKRIKDENTLRTYTFYFENAK